MRIFGHGCYGMLVYERPCTTSMYFPQIISIIVKNDEGWLAGQHSLVSQLRRVWVSEAFQERHRKDNMAATNWKEPKLLAYCLLSYCK